MEASRKRLISESSARACGRSPRRCPSQPGAGRCKLCGHDVGPRGPPGFPVAIFERHRPRPPRLHSSGRRSQWHHGRTWATPSFRLHPPAQLFSSGTLYQLVIVWQTNHSEITQPKLIVLNPRIPSVWLHAGCRSPAGAPTRRGRLTRPPLRFQCFSVCFHPPQLYLRAMPEYHCRPIPQSFIAVHRFKENGERRVASGIIRQRAGLRGKMITQEIEVAFVSLLPSSLFPLLSSTCRAFGARPYPQTSSPPADTPSRRGRGGGGAGGGCRAACGWWKSPHQGRRGGRFR
jgi:hypothetical protein